MVRHALFAAAVSVSTLMIASEALAQDAREAFFDVRPVLLATAEGDGDGALALQYDLKGVFLERALSGVESTGEEFGDPSLPYGAFTVSYEGSGTLAATAADNPLNFIDLGVKADGLYSGPFGTLTGGAFARFESDQSFDSTQVVVGLMATYGRWGALGENSFLSFDVGFGRVAPGDGSGRKAALGAITLDDYDRMQFEALYIYPTGLPLVETVELNYRLYAEVDAPVAIRAAGLDTHELSTVRLGLPHNLFVAYSSGKLPFDRQDDEIFEIGLSYKLE